MIFEKGARLKGFQRIAGIDEAGRGPLAGPVVAAACVFPENFFLEGIEDSKKLSAVERCRLYEELVHHPEVDYGIGIIDPIVIDKINILQATFQAMLAAIANLQLEPNYLLIDGPYLPKTEIPKEGIIDGDALCFSIAAASILAKETRDRIMGQYHIKWPHYGFDRHKGYPTKQHRAALTLHGPSPIHRHSFKPVKDLQLLNCF